VFRDVVLQEAEPAVIAETGDVGGLAGDQVVHAGHLPAVFEESLAKM